MFNPLTGEWTLRYDIPGEWKELPVYYWTGNRLDSVLMGDGLWRMVYDANGNPVRADHFIAEAYKCWFEYDDEGRLARCVKTTLEDDAGTRVTTETNTYTYANGKVQKKETTHDYSQVTPTPDSYISETCFYTWEGDNVIATTRYSEYINGKRDTTYVTYEYTTLPNPFYGFIPLQAEFGYFLMSSNGVDGFSKNLISSDSQHKPEVAQYQYEYTTEGDRVVSFVKSGVAGNGMTRLTTTFDCKLEYAE